MSKQTGSKKLVVIINGKGGVGKDTLIELAGEKLEILNVSSITPVKEAARILGWSGGKEDKDRKFLSDLKELSTSYNDYTTTYLLKSVRSFKSDVNRIMFIHIREVDNIDRIKRLLKEQQELEVETLLIKRKDKENKVYGNKSDDEVENYEYDYIYNNDLSLEKAGEDFTAFLNNMLQADKSKKEA